MAVLNVQNLPDALYAALEARAESRGHTVAQEVTNILAEVLAPQARSILDLEGLGKDVWSGVDAARHVSDERASWD